MPTIRDRVVQAAAKIVLEPIFEADLEDGAYGYRPRRSAIDAVKEVHRLVCRGYTDVVDAADVRLVTKPVGKPDAGKLHVRFDERGEETERNKRITAPLLDSTETGKTDAADAEAISEAVTRKTMRFVPIKSADQQAAAMVLKTNALLLRQQTQAINALRGHLLD